LKDGDSVASKAESMVA
jgi:hypothetical protein